MTLLAQQLAAQKNLSYVLAEKLAQCILKGDYPAGSILPGEMELSELYSVSRTAVREAIKTLAAKGMVLPRPRIGTRIMPRHHWNFLDKEFIAWWMTEDNFSKVIEDFLIMRNSLEPQACSLAAINGSKEQKDNLSAIMSQMVELQLIFDRQRWIEVDMAFHELIYEMSGNSFMTSFANLFRSIYYNYFTAIIEDKVIKLGMHQAIVDAITHGEKQAAFDACLDLLREPGAGRLNHQGDNVHNP